jgi:hypothetical protein
MNEVLNDDLVVILLLAHKVLVEHAPLVEVKDILRTGMSAIPADRLYALPEYQEAMRLARP